MEKKAYIILLLIIFCFSCGEEDYIPKPKGYLRLDYPVAKYANDKLDLPFTFETNKLASNISSRQVKATTESYGINIKYGSLKATVFLTYKAIDGNRENLINFLRDAQKFTLEHTKKADEIPCDIYENEDRKVYGKICEVKGNVASYAQFHVTDSVNHFLTGSLYFDVKTKYDSILPAANYIQNDIEHIMETIEWK